MRHIPLRLFSSVAFVLLMTGAVAHASSVVVNTSLNRFGGPLMGLLNLQVQVTYRADVQNLSTGAVLASGARVAQGTDLLFTCGAHRYQDVYWFSTGYNADSPYGDWVEGAGNPGNLCQEKNYVPFDGRTEAHRGRTYASFAVDPPTSSITGLPASCTTHTDGVSKVCRDVQPGTLDARCSYASTYGKFYGVNGLFTGGIGRVGGPTVSCQNQTNPAVSNQVTVPSASINHTIVVTSTPVNPTTIPAAPTVSAHNASCVVGAPFTIRMSATDPNGDRIRYGVDWDNNGTVDQFVPPSGYVASGTAQTAARTYTTAGAKTIRIFAQDEGGLSSAWATFSFTCAVAPLPDPIPDDEEEVIIRPPIGDGDPFERGDDLDLTLRAIPSLLPPGERTRVHWSSTNADSCTVVAPNGDSWNDLQSPVGGEPSSPILEETIYTLRCLDSFGDEHIRTARVNVLPLWSEF